MTNKSCDNQDQNTKNDHNDPNVIVHNSLL